MCVIGIVIYCIATELKDRGHDVTLYNRGKTPAQRLPGESEQAFEARKQQTKYIKGDRTNAEALRDLIDPSLYTYVYDMNGREATDTAPLADIFASPKSQLKSFIYMSCALHTLRSYLLNFFRHNEHMSLSNF